jgi:exopolyphosphatase/pppGpp-phosphohydrolase
MKNEGNDHRLIDREFTFTMGGVPVDDLDHARHVAFLAQELFTLTWPLHGFGQDEARLLHRAALLHDAGILVAYHGHHKESLRLIMQATLPGISEAERAEVACIARYHRKALPQRDHLVYRDLAKLARQRVRELGGILRLADAFDFAHDGGVSHLYGHVLSSVGKPAQVLLRVVHRITDHEELRDILERADMKRDLFERAFHCRVSFSPEIEAVPVTQNGHGTLNGAYPLVEHLTD